MNDIKINPKFKELLPALSPEEEKLFAENQLGFFAIVEDQQLVIELIPYQFKGFWAVIVTKQNVQDYTKTPIADFLVPKLLTRMGVKLPVQFESADRSDMPSLFLFEGGGE